MSVTEGELATVAGDYAEPDTAPAHGEVARPLARGDVVGRYVVLERLGVGGMGEVYAAYDPELDRKIAIKLLLPTRKASPDSSSGHVRLLREAQAMAKLQHPNVVAVHDVGTHDVRVFVAMEFVDGGNLADWIDEGSDGQGKPHPWPDVLARFLAAGEGLAAAHAAGLIHRDFKPANVLLGRDGSVRVADFGLARQAVLDGPSEPAEVGELAEAAGSTEITDATLPALERSLGQSIGQSVGAGTTKSIKTLSMRMTQTGATLGTPAYMAPEQYAHTEEVDSRADQFSFCVALWEALYGQRPFAGDNLHVLMFAIAQANLREPPSQTDVPAAIRRALTRGLAHDPARRWPDMRSLLTELHRDPGARRRNLGLAALGVAFLGALAWGVAATRPEPPVEEPPCSGAAAALGDALSPARRDAIAEHFAGFEQNWAHDVGERLLPRLDAWTSEWQAAWTDACEATHVRAEQSSELLDRRLNCLDRQRRGFVKLVDGLAKADEELARKADGLLAELGSIASCSDADALLRITPMPADPERAAAIVAAEAALSDVQGFYIASQMNEARAGLEAQAEAVAKLDYAPLSANYEQLRGRLAMFFDDPEGGEQALERAFALALEAGDDRWACRTARSLAYELQRRDRANEAARWLMIASALAERLDDDLLRGQVELSRNQILASLGDYPGAEAAALAAHELLQRAQANSALVGDAMYLMAVASYRAGRYDEALERVERARAAWSTEVGARHPRAVPGIGMLGIIARNKGDYAAAEGYFREAMAIEIDTHGPDHIEATSQMTNLAVALGDQAKYDEAIELFERVLAIRRATPDVGDAWTGRTLVNLAQIQRQAGRLDDAKRSLEEGEALVRATLGDEHPDLVTLIHIRAMIEFERGELEQAERSADAALRLAKKVFGPDDPTLFELQTNRAKIALARGKPRLAAGFLTVPASPDTNPAWLGEREFVEARIADADGKRDEALAAAARARQAFERDGAGSAKQLAELEAWLAERE